MTAEEMADESPPVRPRRQFALTDLIGVSTLIALNVGAWLYWPPGYVVLVIACSVVLLLRRLERLGWLRPGRPEDLLNRLPAMAVGAVLCGVLAILVLGQIPPADWRIPALAATVGGWLFYRFPALAAAFAWLP